MRYSKTKRNNRKNKVRSIKKKFRRSKTIRGGTKYYDELIERMERGESGFKKKPFNFIPGKPLLDNFYARKTEKDKRLDEFHEKIKLEEKAYLDNLESRDRYLRDPRNKALEQRESSNRNELVDYNINKKTGELKQTFRSTRGLDFGLNDEKEGDPSNEDWGFYSLDFRGGKKTRRKKRY